MRCASGNSDGISSWSPLQPQHSNPNPNPLANQLWSIDFLSSPTPLIIPSQTPYLPWISYATSKTDARFLQDAPKAVWSIPYVSVKFFPCLKQNFIAYRSCKVSSRPDCIFEIHLLWQSGFVGCISIPALAVHSNLKSKNQSSHKMYSNNLQNFQEFATILNACTKSLETYWMHHVSLASFWFPTHGFMK